jgi:hypothetical protein
VNAKTTSPGIFLEISGRTEASSASTHTTLGALIGEFASTNFMTLFEVLNPTTGSLELIIPDAELAGYGSRLLTECCVGDDVSQCITLMHPFHNGRFNLGKFDWPDVGVNDPCARSIE